MPEFAPLAADIRVEQGDANTEIQKLSAKNWSGRRAVLSRNHSAGWCVTPSRTTGATGPPPHEPWGWRAATCITWPPASGCAARARIRRIDGGLPGRAFAALMAGSVALCLARSRSRHILN